MQNFKDFRAKLKPEKLTSWRFLFFQNQYRNPFPSSLSLVIVSNPHFLMGFNHLSSASLQNKAIVVKLPMTDICF